MEILKQESATLQISIHTDETWLNDEARVYPVTIDPSIGSGGTTRDTFVSSGAPNNNFGYMGSMYIGNEVTTYKTCRMLLDFDLPKMYKGDMVVQAQLNLVQFANGMSPSTGTMQINAYEISSAWNEHTDTWSNTSAAVETAKNSPILDYAITSQSTNQKVVSWDLTKLAKGWYDSSRTHKGILLAANDEAAAVRNQFYTSDYPSGTGLYPTLTIRYVNHTGLEEYWSYHQQSAGRAGTGHVNDYTGNLVFTIPITGTTGELMPLDFGLTFNSSLSGTQFKDGQRGGTFGFGFRSNLNQRIEGISEANATNAAEKEKFRLLAAAGYKFFYLDEDGTEHYFVTDPTNSARYKDEEGFDLTLTTGGPTDEYYTLSYADGSKKTFTLSGYLKKIYDSDNNALNLTYSGAKIASVTDGAGRVTTLGYTSYGTLDSVTTPDGKATRFRYDANYERLTSITHFDGKVTLYTYNDKDLLNSAIDIDGSKIEYDYQLNASDWMVRNRVTSVKEYSADGEAGNTLSMTYNTDNTTDFVYLSALGKNQKETYGFDRYGRAVSIVNADGSAEDVSPTDASAATYKFTDNGENDVRKNKIAEQAKTSLPVVNLLTNHSAELTDSSWTLYNQTSPGGQMMIASDAAYLGNKSLKVTQEQSNPTLVSAKQVVKGLKGGDTYTFSAYVKTDLVTGGQGANLFAVASDGTKEITFQGQGVYGTGEWQRISVTFTLPQKATEVALHAGLMNARKTAWFDCLQLEAGNVANPYNLLENPSLKYSSGSPTYIPSLWTPANFESNDGISNGELHIKGNPSKNKSLSQSIPINKTAETIAFTMAGKAKGNSVPLFGNRHFAIDLGLYFTDGTTQWMVIPFNADSNGEQYATGPVYAKTEYSQKTIEKAVFYIIYYQNANSAYFYDMQLNMDETGSAFVYDENNGKLKTSRQNAQNNKTYSYDTSSKELITAQNGNNESYRYFYQDAKIHQLKSARSEKTKIGMYYTYDGKGNVVDTKMGTISTSGAIDTTVPANPYLQTTQGYSANGNYVTSISDQRGKTTTYNIDGTTGLTNSVTDPKGNQTSYTYDSKDYSLTGVSAQSSAGTVQNSYGYDASNHLSRITHNGFDYGFTYDGFGNPTNVKAGSQNLITHSYAAGNGNLLSSTYGNGFQLGYEYDKYDRVSSIKKNGADAYQYDYDARGNLARITDTTGGTSKPTEFFYDVGDRLVRKTFGNDTEIRQGYDNMDRSTGQYFRFAGQTRLTAFSYDLDSRKEATSLLSGGKMNFVYDTLNRIGFTTLKPDAGINNSLNAQATFVGDGNRTTTLVDTYSNYRSIGD